MVRDFCEHWSMHDCWLPEHGMLECIDINTHTVRLDAADAGIVVCTVVHAPRKLVCLFVSLRIFPSPYYF